MTCHVTHQTPHNYTHLHSCACLERYRDSAKWIIIFYLIIIIIGGSSSAVYYYDKMLYSVVWLCIDFVLILLTGRMKI